MMTNQDWGFLNFILLCAFLLWLFFKIIIRGRNLVLWEAVVYLLLVAWFLYGSYIRAGIANVFSL